MSGSEVNQVKFTKADGYTSTKNYYRLPDLMPKGSKIPADVERDLEKYNEQADKYYNEQADLIGDKGGVDDLSPQKRKKFVKLMSEAQDLRAKARKKIVAEWIEDLKQQGVKVPASISDASAGVAMEKLAALQYAADLSDRVDQQLGTGGGFGMSVTAALILADINRTKVLDESLNDQLKDMQEQNKLIASTNKVMEDLRAARPEGSDDEAMVPAGIVKFAKDHDISIPQRIKDGRSVNQATWDQFTQNIKTFTNTQQTSSQMKMVKLQSIQQQRNNAFELASNLIKKVGSVIEQIISGMR